MHTLVLLVQQNLRGKYYTLMKKIYPQVRPQVCKTFLDILPKCYIIYLYKYFI